MGALYKRGKWYVFQYMEDGKKKYHSLGKEWGDIGELSGKKKKELKRRLEIRFEERRQKDKHKITELITNVVEVVIKDRYIRLKMDQLSQTTVGGDEKKLNYFKSFVLDRYGIITVDKIDSSLLNSYTDYCRDELGNNSTTINNKHKAVQILIKHCLNNGYLQTNPYDKVIVPTPIKRSKDRIPKQKEYDIVKRYVEDYVKSYIKGEKDYKFDPIIMTSFFQTQLGMRIGEVLIMKWKRGKSDGGEGHSRSYVYLNSSFTELVVYFKKKKRTYPIDEIPLVSELLKKLKDDTNSKVYVLENRIKRKDGRPHPQSTNERFDSTYCSRPLKSMLRRLKVDDSYSTHSLRHGFVTDLIRKNHSLTKIGNLVGYSDVRMTEIYGHLDTSDMRGLLKTV